MVKEGYKETEMGLIPELWSVNSLHEHLLLLTDYDANGSFADMANNVKTTWGNGFAWFVRATDLEQKSEMSEVKYTDKISYEFLKKSALFGKELLVAKRGEIGKVYYFQMKTQYATLGPNLYLLKLKETLNSNFLYWFFLSEIGQEKLKEINASTSLGAIYKDDVKKLKVPIPPLCEQEKIAESLSDMDSLISSLEKLIEKKKAIKQGAVQELLTGKKRLPGFNGKWEQQKLNTCTERIIVGLATSITKHYSAQGTVLFRNLNILPNKLDDSDVLFLDSEFANTYPNKRVKKNDVLTVHTGYVGISCLVPEKYEGALTFTTLITTTKKEILLPEYLMIHLNSELGKKMIELLQAGGGRNNLNVSDFERYEISFPKDTNEQKAIADILFDMDAEITSLEQKLAKCQKLKQGMMQQLLTGKIRLI